MIFTECPTCDEDQAFGWETGMSTGYFPSKCHKCDNVMWVEATSIGGTTLSHEDFKKDIAKEEDFKEIDNAASKAPNHSNIVYETD